MELFNALNSFGFGAYKLFGFFDGLNATKDQLKAENLVNIFAMIFNSEIVKGILNMIMSKFGA